MSRDESVFSKILWSCAILSPPVAPSLGNYSQQKDKSHSFVTIRVYETCYLNYKSPLLKKILPL